MSERDEHVRILREHGTQSPEYRRFMRRQYREMNWRIDYLPDRRAAAVIKRAIGEGWALSYSDAINLALRAWGEDDPE
jgi:hypothetical protein